MARMTVQEVDVKAERRRRRLKTAAITLGAAVVLVGGIVGEDHVDDFAGGDSCSRALRTMSVSIVLDVHHPTMWREKTSMMNAV